MTKAKSRKAVVVDSAEVTRIKTPHFTEVIAYDENGEVKSRKFFKGSANGGGWCMMYTDKVNELLNKCPPSTFRVFMALSLGQQFDERGMITTKRAIQDRLGITKQTCLAAFKWLKENLIINEYKNPAGYTEFMVNPEYVSIGRDKKKRMKEWLRRWESQTVLTLPATTSPIGALVELKPVKEKKQKRSVTCD